MAHGLSPSISIDFQKLFESLPGLYLIITTDFNIVTASDAYLNATMTTLDNIVGRNIFDVFPDNPKDPNATGTTNLRASLNRVLSSGMTDIMKVQKYDVQRPIEQGGGFEERYWSPTNSPVFDSQNNLIFITHRVEDVTEFVKLKQKGLEQELINQELQFHNEKFEVEIFQRSLERKKIQEKLHRVKKELDRVHALYKGILEGSQDSIAALDENLKLIFFNQSFAEEINKLFLKKTRLGMSLLDFLSHLPKEQSKAKNNLQRALQGEVFKSIEEYDDKNLEKNFYETTYNHLLNKKKEIIGIFLIARNINERMQATHALQKSEKELLSANKELEAFSYSVSHDLRAPLRAIDGFSKIIHDKFAKELPIEAQNLLKMVRDSAIEMGHLIDDLLNFSRLSRQPLKKQEFSMLNLVQQVIEELKSSHEGRDINILIEDIPDCCGDKSLLKQVILNLISNAIKYTRNCKAAHIKIGSQLTEHETIYYVKDNGAGFDMAYAHKLFGVFQRLHRQEEYEGTGVGLAIVERIIRRHHGRIWAQAEINKGATFYFTLWGEQHNE